MSSGVADFLTIARLAWELYTKGYAVASAAPEEFRDLLKELDSFRRILYYFGEATKNRELDDTLRNCLRNCVETLDDFEYLAERFERLATSGRGNWFTRIRWATDQSDIDGCRRKIYEHRSNLSLCLQVDQMNHRGGSPSFVGDRDTRSSSLSTSSGDLIELGSVGRRDSVASSDVSSIIARRSPSDTSSLTYPSLLPVRLTPAPGTRAPGYGGMLEFLEEIDGPGPSGGGLEEDRPSEDLDVVRQPLELSEARAKHNAAEAEGLVDKFHLSREVMKKCQVDMNIWLGLSVWWLVKARKVYELTIPGEGRANDPLDRRSPLSTPQAYANLLKSSWILEEEVLASAGDGENLSPMARKFVRDLTEATSPFLRSNPSFPSGDRYSLALDEDLRRIRKQEASIPPKEILLEQDLRFQEALVQHAEEANVRISSRKDDMFSPQRWVTVELRDSGLLPETALYRTFVNAHLGPKGTGHWSRQAPYMLVLWVKEGQSELFVSLFNQRGTINLSKIFTTEDFESYQKEPTPGLVLSLVFPSIAVITSDHQNEFMADHLLGGNWVLEFKSVLASYEPQKGSYGGASGQSANGDKSKGDFCYLGLFESTAKERWKTTRRLVVSSWAKDPQPWCASYWLPFNDVQVRHDGDCGVTLKWSDCNQLDENHYGNHNITYSLVSGSLNYFNAIEGAENTDSQVYKRKHPNKKVYLRFKSHKGAIHLMATIECPRADRILEPETMKFVVCISYLNESPTAIKRRASITPSNSEEIKVYDVFDADKRNYRALVINKRSPEGYSVPSFYYTYRDIDFSMQSGPPETIQFNQMLYPRYISDVVDLPYEPDIEESVCVGVKEDAERVEVTAGDDENSVIEALTGWRLLFFHDVSTVILNEGKRLLSNGTKYQDVGVYLWGKTSELEDGTTVTLCLRLNNEKKDFWLTSHLTGDRRRIETGQLYVRLELELERGRTLDMTTMMASSTSTSAKKSPEKKLQSLKMIFKDKSILDDFQSESKLFGSERLMSFARPLRSGTGFSSRGRKGSDVEKHVFNR